MITSGLPPVAAVGHHRPPVQLLVDAGGAVDDRVVAVARLRVADGDDQAGAGVDGDLQVRRVPVVLAPGGQAVIAGGISVPSTIAICSTGRFRTGARASSGARVSMTRCAAECDTPNSGPIWRIVRFVRQYAATSSTRSARSRAHCRPGRPSAMPVTATLGDQPDQRAELGGLQPGERKDPLRPSCRDHLHPGILPDHPQQTGARVTRHPLDKSGQP